MQQPRVRKFTRVTRGLEALLLPSSLHLSLSCSLVKSSWVSTEVSGEGIVNRGKSLSFPLPLFISLPSVSPSSLLPAFSYKRRWGRAQHSNTYACIRGLSNIICSLIFESGKSSPHLRNRAVWSLWPSFITFTSNSKFLYSISAPPQLSELYYLLCTLLCTYMRWLYYLVESRRKLHRFMVFFHLSWARWSLNLARKTKFRWKEN